MKKLSIALLALLVAAGSVFAGGNAQEDSSKFPSKPVTVIVPWGTGGASDLLFRAIAATFPKYANGQQLIVKNVNGAGSVQGITEFLSTKPDGYTLAMWCTAQTIKTEMAKTPYTAEQFVPIFCAVDDSPYILVKKDSPFKTIQDLIAYAKKNPGKLTIGNSGTGGGNHLAALQFCIAAGIEAKHVPYQGGAKSAQATLAGEIDCSMNVPAEGLTSVDSGDLRMLAVIGDKPMAAYPSVPTSVSVGVNAINRQTRGAVVLDKVPAPLQARLQAIFKQVINDPDFQATLKNKLHMNPLYADGPAYAKMIQDEDALYTKIIKDNKLGDKYK
jgi:tripartite-type tricarboxylate transporter receptor subunit TctC